MHVTKPRASTTVYKCHPFSLILHSLSIIFIRSTDLPRPVILSANIDYNLLFFCSRSCLYRSRLDCVLPGSPVASAQFSCRDLPFAHLIPAFYSTLRHALYRLHRPGSRQLVPHRRRFVTCFCSMLASYLLQIKIY